jgi:uncharacterized membrane protein
MGSAENEQESLAERVSRLESRIAKIEAALTPDPQPTPEVPRPPVVPPAPVIYWQTPQSSRSQPAPAMTAAQAVRPSDPAPQPAATLVPPPLRMSFGELEERLAGRALAVVGGIALILGAIFFLSLAFSRGWIGPELRVLIGLAAGSAAVAGGAAFLERRNQLLGNVLTPVGLAIISISLLGATRLYHIVPTEVGLMGALLSAIVVALVAVRNDSQLVAGFGLVSVLLAPPLLEAAPDSTTLAFIGVALIGTTSIAVWRSWRWLPPIAFLLTVPQAAAWIGSEPAPALALAGIAAYWALNIVAAGGEEFHRHRDDLSTSSATLLLGNAAFVVWAGFVVLDGDLAVHRGLLLLVVAAAHLAVGGFFVTRDGERNLFGLLTLGTGIAALTMAMPIQLGAPAVPVAWTAEAVALAWVATRRGHPYSAAVSAILFLLAALAVGTLYPLGEVAQPGLPFIDERGAALAFFLAGAALGVWIVRDQSLRSALGAAALLVAMYAASAVLTGLSFVLAASALMVLAAAIFGALPMLPDRPIEWLIDGLIPPNLRDSRWREPLDLALPAAMGLFGALSALHLAAIELPIREFGDVTPPPIPFSDAGAAGAGILIVGVLVSGWILDARLGGRLESRTAVLIGGAIAAYTIPFEVYAWAVPVLWVGLGLGALLIAGRDTVGRRAFSIAAGVAMFGAAIVALGIVAPPSRLVVGPAAIPWLQVAQTVVSLAAVAFGTAVLALRWPQPTHRRWMRYAAGVLVVYLLSVLAVDIVGARVGGAIAVDELRTQGQVVLSVLWAVLGVGAFMYGLRSNRSELRQGGLVLLAVATSKVFLFDLAALDVAYRVISFIALGLLLLASAWLWQRAQPKAASNTESPGGGSTAT